MAVLREGFGNSAEWLVLGLVVLATMSIDFDFEQDHENDIEVTQISGIVTLSTRASMDALGLDEFDRGAKANVDIQVQSVVSSQCPQCTGVSMQGPVNVTELIGGGTGRVEANIEVLHLRENLAEGLIAREWLSIHWDVTAGDDFTWDIMVVHDPPLWQPEDRFNAAFSDGESRTGPWILVEAMLDGVNNVQACLPDRSMPCLVTQPDIVLSSTLEPARAPTIIDQPLSWIERNNVTNTTQEPAKTAQVRELLELGEPTSELQAWCLDENEAIVAAQAWNVVEDSTTVVTPMGIYLESLGLPSTSFTPVTGIWTEIDLQERGCASLVDESGALRLGISIHEH